MRRTAHKEVLTFGLLVFSAVACAADAVFAAPADVPAKLTPGAAVAQGPSGVALGKKVYDKWCMSCHGEGSTGHPGTLALTTKYQGRVPANLEQRTDLNVDLVNQCVRHGISMMPFFRKTEISDPELAALGEYLALHK
jgi:cytochrome c5